MVTTIAPRKTNINDNNNLNSNQLFTFTVITLRNVGGTEECKV
jgi:hypothetical protein